MGILNRRNAVLGWTVWQIARRYLKRKARGAVPGTVEGSKRPNRSAIISALAAVAAVIWIWRSRKGEGEPLDEQLS